MITPELLQALLVPLASAAGAAMAAYGAVRWRLAMVERSAARAHRRIDDHLRDHITGAI